MIVLLHFRAQTFAETFSVTFLYALPQKVPPKSSGTTQKVPVGKFRLKARLLVYYGPIDPEWVSSKIWLVPRGFTSRQSIPDRGRSC